MKSVLSRFSRRRSYPLVLVSAVWLAGCERGLTHPTHEPDLALHLSPQVAAQLIDGKLFDRAQPEPQPYPQLSSEHASTVALAIAQQLGPGMASWLEGPPRNAKIDFGSLQVRSVDYAVALFEPVPAHMHPGVRKMYGPVFIVMLDDGTETVMSVALSSYSTDIEITRDDRLHFPRIRGSDFKMIGWPRASVGGPPVTAEVAAALASRHTGALVDAVPRLVLPTPPWSPWHARWEVRLDRTVELRDSESSAQYTTDRVYVGYLDGGIAFADPGGNADSIEIFDYHVPLHPDEERRETPPITLRRRLDMPSKFLQASARR